MTPLALAFASIVSSNTPAQALSFNFTFSDNTPLAVRSVFWEAGDAWSKQFTDDVIVNIFVDYGQVPTNVLAGSRPGMTRVTYSEFRTRLDQDKSSQDVTKYTSQDYDDALALSKLPNGTSFKYLRNAHNATNNTWGGSTEVGNGDTVWLTLANAKALGLIAPNTVNYNNFDASIRISNTTPWHYDTNLPAPNDKQDLLTVTTHEIGHVLGFVSGLDAFQLLAPGGNLTAQNLKHVTPMDLLRYSKQSAALGIPDWTKGETFFSVDGGGNKLGDFSSGSLIDGFQAGHWKHSHSWGVMNPLLKSGKNSAISELDRQLLDAIGWDYATPLSKNLAVVMLGINWNTSDPDLSLLEKLLKAHLSMEMENLRVERDAIKDWDPKVWLELKEKADKEVEKRQEEIQKTLNKIRDEKHKPDKRLEKAFKGASDLIEALVYLKKDYQEKLQPTLAGQINDSLNGSEENLKKILKGATLLQLKSLMTKVENAEESQRNEWKKDIRGALRLLYQETHNNQNPSEIELNTALAKLLNDATLDDQEGRSGRFWQTGDTKSSFENTGEFTFESSAASETASVPEPAWKTGMLGLLGLFGIGSVLKQRGKKSSRHNTSVF